MGFFITITINALLEQNTHKLVFSFRGPYRCMYVLVYVKGTYYASGFHTGFFAGGREVIVKVVLACVSTATHVSAYEQPRGIWGHVPK